MHLTGEIDMLRSERGEDVFNEFKAFVRGAVLDQNLYHGVTNARLGWSRIEHAAQPYQRLTLRVDFGAVQRVAGYDLYISRKVFVESSKLRGLAGRLTSDDGTEFGCLIPSQNVLGLGLGRDQLLWFDTYMVRTVPRPCR
jgi:hypothetical protein